MWKRSGHRKVRPLQAKIVPFFNTQDKIRWQRRPTFRKELKKHSHSLTKTFGLRRMNTRHHYSQVINVITCHVANFLPSGCTAVLPGTSFQSFDLHHINSFASDGDIYKKPVDTDHVAVKLSRGQIYGSNYGLSPVFRAALHLHRTNFNVWKLLLCKTNARSQPDQKHEDVIWSWTVGSYASF